MSQSLLFSIDLSITVNSVNLGFHFKAFTPLLWLLTVWQWISIKLAVSR